MSKQLTFNPVNLMPLAARVPRVTDKLSWADRMGAIEVRLAINRHNYAITPGLYGIGNPGKNSDVFVTSNYKLTFDVVRKNLAGINAWILVLDTKGINVWCAAGKGTFGTAELIKRIDETFLKDIVSHRKLILPQLGAVGVAAHKVKSRTGFSVTYGPVRAQDIPAFIKNGYKADAAMRKVNFPLSERFKLIPVEMILGYKYLLIALILLLGISGLDKTGFSFSQIKENGISALVYVIVAYLSGTLFTPMLLPYIPFRSFSAKGLAVGLFVSVIMMCCYPAPSVNILHISSWLLIYSAVSSFLAMNFTGASTFTSLSGVLKEMKIAIPFQIGVAALGLVLLTLSKFYNINL